METKQVRATLPAEMINMGGLFIRQALPTMQIQSLDPFLLLHDARLKFNANTPAKHQGVGPHPHRGFSPVTFILEGAVHHRDSRGNDHIAEKNSVQWMHAGMGIIHSERPSQAIIDAENRQSFIQLWVNSPQKAKMDIPSYQYASVSEMPVLTSDHESIKLHLVCGQYRSKNGPIQPISDVTILWGKATASSTCSIEIKDQQASFIYLMEGTLNVGGYGILEAQTMLVFEDGEGKIPLTATTNAQFICAMGRPLNEPIVQQGPFVMNTETEILQAMRDYQMGKMGFLIE